MVRTQIQLTEEQFELLKKLSGLKGISMAALIRRGIDYLLQTSFLLDEEEQRRLALKASGRFHSSRGDLAVRHDEYLREAYQS